MVRSMLLRNSQIRAFDKFFDDAWSTGFRNPFAVMDSVLESITKPIPPEPGTKFTVYKMVPAALIRWNDMARLLVNVHHRY